MAATSFDLEIEQGTTLHLRLTYRYVDGTPVPLTGWSGRMQIRRKAGTPALVDVGTATSIGGMALEPLGDGTDTGVVDIKLTPIQTQSVNRTSKYDVLLWQTNDPTEAVRLLRGSVLIDKSVTLDEAVTGAA